MSPVPLSDSPSDQIASFAKPCGKGAPSAKPDSVIARADNGMEQWSVTYEDTDAILTVMQYIPDESSTLLLFTLSLLDLVTYRRWLSCNGGTFAPSTHPDKKLGGTRAVVSH